MYCRNMAGCGLAAALGGMGGVPLENAMEHSEQDRRTDHEVRNVREILCPNCSSELRLMISILDTRTGRTFYLVRCRCGHVAWDE
jgi:hypothetical protein